MNLVGSQEFKHNDMMEHYSAIYEILPHIYSRGTNHLRIWLNLLSTIHAGNVFQMWRSFFRSWYATSCS